jgi:hypothetical protein
VATAKFNLRRLSPRFPKALDGFHAGGLTSEALLPQLIVSTFEVAETEPLDIPVG